MNVTMSQKMSNSNVFETLLRHFGGTPADETGVDPTTIAADPISDFQILPCPVAREDSITAYSKTMDFKRGIGSQPNLPNAGTVRRVSSSSPLLSGDAQAAFQSINRTPSPSIYTDVAMLSAGISNEMASIDSSHNSGCSSHSGNNYSTLQSQTSLSNQTSSWMTSGIVSSKANCNSRQNCSMGITQSSIAPQSPQSFPSTMQNNGWGGAMDVSMTMQSSNASISVLPFDGKSDSIRDFSFSANSSSSSTNSKNVVGAWSDKSAKLMDDLASSMKANSFNKKGRKKHDAGKPKRPLSAYNIFFKQERQRILEELPQEILKQDVSQGHASTGRRSKKLSAKELLHRKIDFHCLAKLVGRRWRELPASELEQYKSIAQADLQRYKREMNVYKASMLIKEMGNQDNQSEHNPFFQDFDMSEPLSFQADR